MGNVWTPLTVLNWTTERFAKAGSDSPRLDAQVLLAHALGCSKVELYTAFNKPLSPEELAKFRALIERRLAGEPVAYLVGEREFWSLPLHVDARVLIPRADSELVVEVVAALLADTPSPAIVDVGTGSGAIAIALAVQLPAAHVLAIDCSADALEVAAMNVERHGVTSRVTLRQGDLLAPAGTSKFHAIVSNAPYIPTDAIETLSREVLREPRRALDGGVDGLDYIRKIVEAAPLNCQAGAVVALEHGFDQAAAVTALFAANDAYARPHTHKDLAGHPRVTVASIQ